MAYRIAYLGLALGALSACTFTTQAGPQPANGYYAPMPPPAAPVAASPVYISPAARPERTAATPVARPVTPVAAATAPSSPPSAARPPTAFRPPTAGAAQRPVIAPPPAETPVATTPPATTPATVAPPAQTSGPLSPPVRRPVGNQKAETRDKTSDAQVK